MPERTASGRVTAELEAELARLDRDQLLRLCAHLIRTYVIEPGRGGAAGTAPAPPQESTETPAVPPPVAAAPPPVVEPAPPAVQERRTQGEPEKAAQESDDRFNKLEMD
jgi:hypothetical protein